MFLLYLDAILAFMKNLIGRHFISLWNDSNKVLPNSCHQQRQKCGETKTLTFMAGKKEIKPCTATYSVMTEINSDTFVFSYKMCLSIARKISSPGGLGSATKPLLVSLSCLRNWIL